MANRYPLKRVLLVQGLYSLGFILLVIAAACFYAYGREIFASIGSADKSLLFWYLPILFIGIFCARGAVMLGVIARRQSSKKD